MVQDEAKFTAKVLRVLLRDLIVKVVVPLPEMVRDVGDICRLPGPEGVIVKVPEPVVVRVTVPVLAPFFLIVNDEGLAVIVQAVPVPVIGGAGVELDPLGSSVQSAVLLRTVVPDTTVPVTTSAVEFTLA